MSNDFYTPSGSPASQSSGSSAVMRAEFSAIQLGFDKLPTLTGNGGEVVVVNSGGTALETVATLPVSAGGTGAATAADARTALGANNASNLTSGTVAAARLGSGTANSSTYLRGDNTWGAAVAVSSIDVSGGTTGLTTTGGPVTSAGTITLTGTLAVANGGTGATSAGAARTALGAAAASHSHAASDITSGTIDPARLGSGTADSGSFLRGDNTWVAVSGTGSVTSVAVSGGTTGLTTSGGPITSSGTITLAGTLAATNGGTGHTSYTVGDLLAAGTTTTLDKVAAAATGQVLLSAGVGAKPTWGQVSLTTHVADTLPVANGGTGATTLTGMVKGNGTGAFTAAVAGTDYVSPAGAATLTNKTITLADNSVSGTAAQFNTALTDADFATQAGVETLSNKTIDSTCTKDGTNGIGYLNIPQNSQSGTYTLVIGDAGKHIYRPTGDTTANTWTIPANSSVAFPIGTAITFVNDGGSDTNVTISITSDTLVFSPDGTTGSRTLGRYGVATAIKVASTRWIISGTNLT